jgi:hypothetical protein
MKRMHETALCPARVVWEYLQLKHDPIPADVIVVFGTNDLRVARFAARLYHEGFGHSLVCTGGMAHQGDLLATNWHKTEAEMYPDEASRLGDHGGRGWSPELSALRRATPSLARMRP